MTSSAKNAMVSVLITVYNGMPYIVEAVQSILGQTYPYFEIVVVDDGSTDDTVTALHNLAQADDRIRVFVPGRLGRGRALNYGLAQSCGEFVAINDADDLSYPERLEKQVNFLTENPDYGLVGCFPKIINLMTGETRINTYPTSDEKLRLRLAKGACFNHTEIMFRRSVLDKIGGYDESRRVLLDRDVIIRTAAEAKIAKIPEILIITNHHNNRFFFYTFQGRERIIQDYLLRMKAIRLLRLPPQLLFRTVVQFAWAFVPTRVREIIRHLLPCRFLV